MQISILGTDGAYLANNGSNAISILGPDGNLLPNDGTNFVCVTGSDGAYQPNDGTVEAFSILGTDGALKPYEEGNSFSVLDENGALAIPITDNLISPLLWGGAQGAWYDPSDLSTMHQGVTGEGVVTATGQSVGLILDKRLGMTLGSDLATNGDFSVNASWGTLLAGASIAGGVLAFDGATSMAAAIAIATQTISVSVGDVLSVTWTITGDTTRGVSVGFNGGSSGVARTAVGTYTDILVATGTTLTVFTRTNVGVRTGGVDNIIVKKIAGNHAYQATSASRPIFRDVAGLRYLEFDGVDDRLVASFAATQPLDRISGLSLVALTSSDRVITGGDGSIFSLLQDPGLLYAYSGSGYIPLAVSAGVRYVITERYAGASSRIAKDNGAYVTGNAGTNDQPTSLIVGAENSTGGAAANIHLHQLIMRGSTTAMTDAEIRLSRLLCAAKAGVTL